jgi:hydroxymethylpyrimidine pyrophosphatase-like HAD family hydrolase
LLGSYQSKGVNQALTYLIPPKQRSKVRFMNLKPVVVWATKILACMDKLNEKESTFFKELPQHTPFIEGLTEMMYFEEKVTKALKTNGLTQQFLFKIIQELTLFKALDFGLYNNLKDKFAVCFEGFLAKYQTVLDQTKAHNLVSLNVSTDIIESLFAKYKAIMPSNKYHLMASTAIELPIYCTDDNNKN